MVTAVVLGVVILALIVGTIMILRLNAKTGMPTKEVLDRAARRARELKSSEEDDGSAD